jgi:hypothetical protein
VRQIEVTAAGRHSIAGISCRHQLQASAAGISCRHLLQASALQAGAAVSAFQGRQQQCWQRQGMLFMAPGPISGKQQVHQ